MEKYKFKFRFLFLFGLFLLLPLCSFPLWAKVTPHNRKDMDGWAEHLMESTQNSRFVSLPWSTFSFDQGKGQVHLQVGYSDNAAGILRETARQISFSTYFNKSSRFLWGFQGFYDTLKFSGTRDVQNFIWIPLTVNPMPIDTPEHADFSNPRGSGRQFGFGPSFSYKWDHEKFIFNLSQSFVFEVVDIKKFQLDYKLTGGAYIGSTGYIDYAFKEYFLLYMGQAKWEFLVLPELLISPTVTYFVPLPRQTFHSRIVGSNFDVKGDTKSAGNGIHIMDAFGNVGLALEHKGAHLSWDAGTFLLYPSWEKFFDFGTTRVRLYSANINYYF